MVSCGWRVRHRVEVRVVGVAILAPPGVDGDPVLGHERRGDVVLGRQRVARREDDLGAAGLERAHQVGGLGGDVQAGPDPQTVERPLALEALADQAQDGHLALGPLDPADALGGEAEVGDVVGRAAWWWSSAVGLLAAEQATERRGEVRPRRAEAMHQPLLEPDVLGCSPAAGRR